MFIKPSAELGEIAPGNIPDVIAVENATKQLKVLGLEQSEVISDCGFYNLCAV